MYIILLDKQDEHFLSDHTWWFKSHRNTVYAVSDIAKRRVYLHRLIVQAAKGQIVDHIDGNGLNNQRSNLRLCSNKENLRNGKGWKSRAGRYKGVSFDKSRGLWASKISKDYRTINLGRFKSEEEAARAYDKAAILYFGEFAKLNFKEAA